MKKSLSIKSIVVNALLAALYAVITILSGPLSFNGGSLQLRFSEILCLLVFFNPKYTLGVTLGCLLANIMSMYGWPDLVLGTFATFLTCILIILVAKTVKNLFLASLIPAIINGLIVPFVIFLYDTSIPLISFYWFSFLWVSLGEIIVVTIVGYPIFLLISKKYKGFFTLIDASINTNVKW